MKKIFLICLVVLIVVLAGCTQPGSQNNSGSQNNQNNAGGGTVDLAKIVEKGDKIEVEYKGTLEDGREFDSSAKFGRPLGFEAGACRMIKGFDAAVLGMRLNDEKTITLKPADAYGQRDESKVIEVPKENIADFNRLKVGMTLSSPEAGDGTVAEIKSDSVIIDFNPPMAGKTLTFWIKIVSIEKK
ncbi:MAG: peptidylprolyl isomerase [Candidatus ainarchaeum sp.]|nr:peptidylprolyl isomerase [Candidatus ainarchaeum sp.]